ncbi:peptidoglycan-binding protein [Streptomyces sp. M19]
MAVAVAAVAAAAFMVIAPDRGSSPNDEARTGTSASAGHDSAGHERSDTSTKPSPSRSPEHAPSSSPGQGDADPPRTHRPTAPGGLRHHAATATPAAPAHDPTTAPDPPKQHTTSAPPKPWKSCHYYSGTALTQYGDKGNRVRQVQCILKARGYDIGPSGVDGDFGTDTRVAVKRFQKYHHLDIDGQVGVDTWPALRG